MESPFEIDLTRIERNSPLDNRSKENDSEKSKNFGQRSQDFLYLSVPELTQISSIFSSQTPNLKSQLSNEIIELKQDMIMIFDQVSQRTKNKNHTIEKISKLETKLKKNEKKLGKIKKLAQNHQATIELLEKQLFPQPTTIQLIQGHRLIAKPSEIGKYALPSLKIKPRKLEKADCSPSSTSACLSLSDKSRSLKTFIKS
jgi:hypothetical protein